MYHIYDINYIIYFKASPSQTSTVATEQLRLRKKSYKLNRSDSTGSSSGRKFLAPTLSDPQVLRNDKYGQKKKSNLTCINSGVAASGNISTPTGTRPRNPMLQTDHVTRNKTQVVRPETTNESEEYEDVQFASMLPWNTMNPISKQSTSDTPNLTHHVAGFDLQPCSNFDALARLNNIFNNNSSSTGSNIIPTTSKTTANFATTSSSNTNVAYEVHDWWTDQVNMQSSDEDIDE